MFGEREESLFHEEKATGTITHSVTTNNEGGYNRLRQLFTGEMECELTKYLLTCSQMNPGLTFTEASSLH